MADFIDIPSPPIDLGFLYYLGIMIALIVAILWREVIDPYRKRDWMKAYIITHGNKMKPVDIKPNGEQHFEWNKGIYFFPKNPFTREYKITVKKCAIYKEGISHPLLYQNIDTTTGKLKNNPNPSELREAIKASNMKQLMTPKMPWKEQVMFAVLGIGAGISIGLLLSPQFFPCPICK